MKLSNPIALSEEEKHQLCYKYFTRGKYCVYGKIIETGKLDADTVLKISGEVWSSVAKEMVEELRDRLNVSRDAIGAATVVGVLGSILGMFGKPLGTPTPEETVAQVTECWFYNALKHCGYDKRVIGEKITLGGVPFIEACAKAVNPNIEIEPRKAMCLGNDVCEVVFKLKKA
jgi:hypothetical protein